MGQGRDEKPLHVCVSGKNLSGVCLKLWHSQHLKGCKITHCLHYSFYSVLLNQLFYYASCCCLVFPLGIPKTHLHHHPLPSALPGAEHSHL